MDVEKIFEADDRAADAEKLTSAQVLRSPKGGVMRILFVCTGNTCRSPMAEFIFRETADKELFLASSGGLSACDGDGMSFNALAVLAENGIDGRKFRSRMVTGEMAEDSSLILTMTSAHRAELCRRYPAAASKCRTLLEKSGGGDISDPYGQSVAVYRRTLEEIRAGVDGWLDFLRSF